MNSIKKVFLSLLLITIAVSYSIIHAEDLMDRAVKEYLRGDYSGAIEDFERVLEMGPNDKAKRLLFKSYYEEASRKVKNSEFSLAKEHLDKAKELQPNDPNMLSLLSEVKKKLGISDKKEERVTSTEIKALESKVSSARREKSRIQSRLNNISSDRKRLSGELNKSKEALEEAKSKIETLANEQKRKNLLFLIIVSIIGVVFLGVGIMMVFSIRNLYYTTNESQYQLEDIQKNMEQRIKDAEDDSEALEERVAKSINQMIEGQKLVVKQITHSATGKTKDDIEEIKAKIDTHYNQQIEGLLDLLHRQAKALATETTEKVELEGSDGRRIITDINPHVRARADGVEMIPKTISDPKVAEKMLRPYLTDPNNRVRGNACVAIHQYNPAIALEHLEKMATSADKWMRLSAAWALGEISSPEGVTILRKLIDDTDERVRERAIKAFESMAEAKKDIGAEIKKMIDDSSKEGV